MGSCKCYTTQLLMQRNDVTTHLLARSVYGDITEIHRIKLLSPSNALNTNN